MTGATTTVFETVALRLLIDLFPRVEGVSMDFLYAQVTKQTFSEDRLSRRLQDTYRRGGLDIEFKVVADIMPGDPEHFDFQWVIETFFSVYSDEFLARLQAASDFFIPIHGNGVGVVNGEEPPLSENNDKNRFFTMPILIGLATATLTMFLLGTLVTRTQRREDTLNENRLGSVPMSSSDEEDPSFVSSIGEEEVRVNHANIFRFPQCGAESYSTAPPARSRYSSKVSSIYNKYTVRRSFGRGTDHFSMYWQKQNSHSQYGCRMDLARSSSSTSDSKLVSNEPHLHNKCCLCQFTDHCYL
jgi:hypothetical protein